MYDRIKLLREEKNLSQQDLANEMEISQSSLGNYERGDRVPDADIIKRLADYFDVSADYILGRIDTKRLQNVDAHEQMGLTDEAISCLAICKDIEWFSITFNEFITNKRFLEIINSLYIFAFCSQSEELRLRIRQSLLNSIEIFTSDLELDEDAFEQTVIRQINRYLHEVSTADGIEELMLSELKKNIERVAKGIKNKVSKADSKPEG